ncbi:aminopeptidase [Spirochaetia bacterium]|nr:aminopeptidase [Spirochaetia bacterium]
MLGYLSRAIPLEKLPEKDPESQAFVDRVMDIRNFATQELGLKNTKNYTRYVELDRNFLASVVSGSAKDSFKTYQWWFPIVGKVPYTGFFNEDGARKQAEKLKNNDQDTLIRRVDAFSTLGWFSDPLYSYMRDYPAAELADLIIHESLHATVYISGKSQFNEELAEFVGTEGSRLYIEKRFGPESEEYKTMINSRADSAVFISFIQDIIRELESLYTSDVPREEKLELKKNILKSAQNRFDEQYETLFKSDKYRFFSKMSVNNAYLDLFRLYYDGQSFYQDLYTRSGSEIRKFIGAAQTIKNAKNPKEALEKALGI